MLIEDNRSHEGEGEQEKGPQLAEVDPPGHGESCKDCGHKNTDQLRHALQVGHSRELQQLDRVRCFRPI